MITATLIFSLIVISIMQNWLLLAFFLIFLFSARFGTVALIPLAVMVDGYFGNYYSVPFLSFSSVAWFILFELLRPRFSSFKK